MVEGLEMDLVIFMLSSNQNDFMNGSTQGQDLHRQTCFPGLSPCTLSKKWKSEEAEAALQFSKHISARSKAVDRLCLARRIYCSVVLKEMSGEGLPEHAIMMRGTQV